MSKIQIFLDDERTPDMVYKKTNNDDWVIIRNVPDFKLFIDSHEPEEIEFISFDNDLGEELEGKDAVNWLVFEKGYDIREMDFNIHSANIARWSYMEGTLNNWKKHLLKNGTEG